MPLAVDTQTHINSLIFCYYLLLLERTTRIQANELHERDTNNNTTATKKLLLNRKGVTEPAAKTIKTKEK